jgi:hypothetical protein
MGSFTATIYRPNYNLFTTIDVRASLENSCANIINGLIVFLANSNNFKISLSVSIYPSTKAT